MSMTVIRVKNHLYNNPSLKKYTPDDRINSGSLVLLDPGHVAGKLNAAPTVVNNGTTQMINIAAKQAAAITGGTEANQHAQIIMGAGVTAASVIATELTSKGALHGMVSQTNQNGTTRGFYITTEHNDIRDYIYNNPTHQYYYSMVRQITRVSPGSPSIVEVTLGGLWNNTTTGNTNGILSISTSGYHPTSGGTFLGHSITPGFNLTSAPTIQRIGATGWMGTAPTAASQLTLLLANWGNPLSLNSGSFFQNQWPSYALYSVNLVDLTVAGLSYADYAATDLAEINKMLATRYLSDTWSDPTIVMP